MKFKCLHTVWQVNDENGVKHCGTCGHTFSKEELVTHKWRKYNK